MNNLNINKIRVKKIKSDYLLTNDYGNWTILNQKEYNNFKFGYISKNIFEKLENNNIILTKNNKHQTYNQINNYYSHLNSGTSLHILIPTLRCNFTCKYCYALRAPEEEKNKDMTSEILDKTLDFIFTSSAKNIAIEFSGGEPLLRFDLVKEAILKAKKLSFKTNKNIDFAIITNGSLINDDMIYFFKKHKIGICLSLDGPKHLHDNNRKFTKNQTGTYDSTINTINNLKNQKLNINALPVIVKQSLKHWQEIVDEYINLGFVSLRFKYVSRFGFASSSWDSLSYSAEEYLTIWKKVINYMLELNKKGVIITENLTTIMLEKILLGNNPKYAELESPCGAVVGQLVYDYDGRIYTCDEARTMKEFEIGNVFESTFIDLLNHKTTKSMQAISNLTVTCDECSWVGFCGICPLEIYKQEKGFITNIPSNYRCKIHKGMFNFLFEKITNDTETKKLFEKWVLIKGGIKGFYDNGIFKNPFQE